MSITKALADKTARTVAAARKTHAETVKKLAAGYTFADDELDAVSAALAALNVTTVAVDEMAALYAQYPALKAAVANLPSADERAIEKAKLMDELSAAEGKYVVAQRTRQYSAQMENDLAELRRRVNRFGQEDERIRSRLEETAARLAPIFALVGPPPEPKPAASGPEENPPAKGKRATVAAK